MGSSENWPIPSIEDVFQEFSKVNKVKSIATFVQVLNIGLNGCKYLDLLARRIQLTPQ